MSHSPPPDGRARPDGDEGGARSEEVGADPDAGSPPRTKNPWLIPLILGVVLLVIVAALFITNLVGAGEEPHEGPATDQTGGETTAETEATEDTAGEATEDAAGEATEDATEEPADETTESEQADGEPSGTPTDREVNTTPLEELLDPIIVDTGFELSEDGWIQDQEALDDGAREAVTGVYTDGATEVTATAAAFESMEAQDRYAESLVAEQPAEDLTNEDTVYIDETGYFWAFEHEDDEVTIIWRTDIGVVLSVSGESSAAEEVFANMSI